VTASTLRAALEELVNASGGLGDQIYVTEVIRLLARFPEPVLPEGAVPVGPEAWWERQDDGRWRVCVSRKTWTRAAFTDDGLREMGVLVPEPAPTITVGCIVRTPHGWVGSIEAIVHRRAVLFTETGRYLGSWSVDEMKVVAPSREAYGWPPIEETRA